MPTLTGTTATYHHADHLSVRVTADPGGSKIGEQWHTANTTTRFFFTSCDRSAKSGND